MKTKLGFTIIELMIVVTIVSILAVIAIPAYNDYINEKNRSENGNSIHQENMLNYAKSVRPDLFEWTTPFCSKLNNHDVIFSCAVSGINKENKHETIYADCNSQTCVYPQNK